MSVKFSVLEIDPSTVYPESLSSIRCNRAEAGGVQAIQEENCSE